MPLAASFFNYSEVEPCPKPRSIIPVLSSAASRSMEQFTKVIRLTCSDPGLPLMQCMQSRGLPVYRSPTWSCIALQLATLRLSKGRTQSYHSCVVAPHAFPVHVANARHMSFNMVPRLPSVSISPHAVRLTWLRIQRPVSNHARMFSMHFSSHPVKAFEPDRQHLYLDENDRDADR